MSIHFAREPNQCARKLEQPPRETSFPVRHAQCSTLELSDAALYLQEIDGGPFTIRLYTLSAKRSQPLTIRLHENGVYFIYLFEGKLNHLLGGSTPFRLRARQYCGCYLPVGDYPVGLPPGRHELFLFGFPYGYLIWLARQYTFLQPLAQAWKERPTLTWCLPKMPVLPADRRLLAKLARDDQFMTHLATFLSRYGAQLSQRSHSVRDESLLAAVRTYLEQHFSDPQAVKLAAVATHFGHVAPSLRKAFAARYGRSMADVVSSCRVEKAKKLLANTELSLDTVAERVGFGNAAYLKSAIVKTADISPELHQRAGTGTNKWP